MADDKTSLLTLSINKEECNDKVMEPTIESTTATKQQQQRVMALDVLRGMTIMLMIVANSMPSFSYWPFHHAVWNGVTPTDFVFPFFLFISGYAIGITFRNIHVKQDNYNSYDRVKFLWFIPMQKSKYNAMWIWLKILKRAIILFSLGMLMNVAVAVPDFRYIRIMNVLQRISLCYLTVSFLVCAVETHLQIAFVVALQILYLVFTFAIQVPGCNGRGHTDSPSCSVQGYLDRIMFGQNHLYRRTVYDPEGALGTLSAITTCYLGVIYFKMTRVSRASDYMDNLFRQVTHWMLMSGVLLALAFSINPYFPFNKRLWSTSFAILTPALAGIALSLIAYVVDIERYNKIWTAPFLWVGSNPLLLYIGPEFLQIALERIPAGHGDKNLFQWLFRNCFLSWIGNTHFASLLFAVSFELVWFPLAAFLYHKKIFVKI